MTTQTEKYNGLKVGQRVTTSGYQGTVTRLCEWSDWLVEVRLERGTCCIDAKDCIPA